jgi:hypothetical protein
MPLAAASTEVPYKGLIGFAANGSSTVKVYPLLGMRRQSLPAQKEQVDSSTEPGEASLTPLDLWRRTQDDWGLGSGQNYFDRNEKGDRAGDEPSRSRFQTSQGINPWTIGEIGLLNDTTLSLASANTNLQLVVAGARLYVSDGTNVKYTTNLTAWNTVTSPPGAAVTSMATDGYTVYIAFGSGTTIRTTNTGTGAMAAWGATHQADLLGFVRNRLIGTLGTGVFNYTSSSASTTLTPTFLTAPTGFTWNAIGETFSHILVAGNVGDKAMVWGTTILPEGTNLGAMRVVGRLPDGENIRSLGFYLGFVLLGTTKGVRIAFGGEGDVTPGPLIPTTSSVLAFEPQDNFVWYGLTNFTATATGLGRLNLADFVASLKPATASDLMTTGSVQGAVSSVVSFLNRRVFAVQGSGIWTENITQTVASGTLDVGRVTYGVPERLFAKYVETNQSIGAGGGITVAAATDGGAFGSASALTGAGTTVTLADGAGDTLIGRDVNLRFTLTRQTDLSSPELYRWTLRAYPIVKVGEALELTVDLRDLYSGQWEHDQEYLIDVADEFAFLKGLRTSGLPVTLQIGEERMEALIDSVELVSGSNEAPAVEPSADGLAIQGSCRVVARVFS